MTVVDVQGPDTTLESIAAKVDGQIAEYEEQRTAYAALLQQEMELTDSVPVVRETIVARLIGTDNPQTKRPHSASSAEEAAVTDPAFLDLKGNLRGVVFAKNQADTKARAAYLRAKVGRDLLRIAIRSL